ncbi:uncharacterized protein LOC126905012 [Daktulosphaira vitifoliae]|uniref:uncharacterized protein LOC126905012 n=1 Tax=Daktulosphaira vitifoliae TaxID=58002 RepID=UPI0021AA1A16|nr:uncharacterized protein LOC126905012 [Daktulosphaira vitifoliae]
MPKNKNFNEIMDEVFRLREEVFALRLEHSKSHLSFRDVEESLSKFSGDDAYPVNRWIEEIEEMASVLRWSDPEKLIYGKRLLMGTAQLYIQSERGITTWTILKDKLKNEFKSRMNTAAIHRSLSERFKKIDESYQQYVFKMKQIAQLGNIEEDSLIDYIIAGIRDLEVNKMILYGATSIDELKLKLELYEKMKLNVRANTKSNINFSEKKYLNELPNASFKSYKHEGQSANINRCYNCGAKGHRSSSCPDASKGFKCFLCQEFGHKASSCSYRPSTSQPNTDRSQRDENVKIQVNQVIDVIYPINRISKLVDIQGVETNALVDTGSDVNLCRRSFMLKLDEITIRKDKTLLGGPGGVKFYTEGVFTCKLSVDGSSYTTDIYVVPDEAITCDLLVGKVIFQTSAELHINPKCVRITKFEEEENQIMSINIPCNQLNIGASTYKEEINNIVKDYEPNKVKHAPIETVILLMDEKPVYQRPRRLSPAETCEVDKQIEEWLQEDIIRPSCSDYASPIVLVRKKDNSLRPCVDYRMLNRKIIKDIHSLPLIDDQIDKLQGASVYTNAFVEERDELRKEAQEQIFKAQEEQRKTFNKKRKEAHKYHLDDLVAILRTQFKPLSKIHKKFLGPYQITKRRGPDRYEMVKIGESEGPIRTSSGVDYMKPWSQIDTDDEEEMENCQSVETTDQEEGRNVGTIGI